MSQKFFEIRLPLDGDPVDLGELEAVVNISRTIQNTASPRDDEFDTRYRSDAMFSEVITWMTSGAAIAAIAALKSILTVYLKNRNKEVSIVIGANKLVMKGPLSQTQIDETVGKFIQSNESQ